MKTAAAPMLVFARLVAVGGATIATLRELYPDILLAASFMLCVLPNMLMLLLTIFPATCFCLLCNFGQERHSFDLGARLCKVGFRIRSC